MKVKKEHIELMKNDMLNHYGKEKLIRNINTFDIESVARYICIDVCVRVTKDFDIYEAFKEYTDAHLQAAIRSILRKIEKY